MIDDSSNIIDGYLMEPGHMEAQRRKQALFDHSLDGILLIDDLGTYIDANPAACSLLGFSHAELLAKSVWDLTPDIQIEEGRGLWRQFISKGKLQGEHSLRTKEGKIIEVEFSAVTNIEPGVHLSIIRDITDRKIHERELHKSEEFLAKAQHIASLGSWDLDITCGKLSWSDEIFRIYGREPGMQEISDDAFLDGVHPDDRPAVLAAVKRAVANEVPYDIEYRIILPDGTERIVHGQAEVTFDETGKPLRMTGTVLDITARRNAEEALRESEERYQLVISGTAAGVWDWNILTDGMDYSPRFKELLGYGDEYKFTGSEYFSKTIHPDDVEYTRQLLELHFKELAPYEIEYRLRKKNGEYRWFLSHGQAQWDSQGKVCRMVGSIIDIHDRKLGEQQIREQAMLLDEAGDAIIVRDIAGYVLYWNKSAQRVHGWPSTEVLWKRVQDFMIVDPDSFETAMSELMERGHWNGETETRHKDGHHVLVESRWTLMREEGGYPKCIFVINTDITEKKRLEAQFLRSQRMETIGTLVGGIAHDLNNVLGPIIMGVDLLKLRLKDPRDHELLKMIETSGKHGVDVVKQILHFARGGNSRTPIDLNNLIGEIEKIATETLPKSISVVTEVPEEIWKIQAERTQIHQVLLNLCINARDAMPEGGSLRITARNQIIDQQFTATIHDAKPGPHVVLEVADSGEGIPSEILDKIFDPFFTTKKVGSGTGLGLSTTMGIVRNHGGFITVESKPGIGTAFKVALPALMQTGSAAEIVSNELSRGNGETILLIDDEAAVRSITGQTLEAFGYQVITASDGAQGVDQYAKHQEQIAAVLTDMMMPVMDGVATIRVLKRMNPDVKIIAASGWSAKGMEEEAISEGVVHFMHKPYTAETMLSTLSKVLQS